MKNGEQTKPLIVNQQLAVYSFQYDLCDAGYVSHTCGHLHNYAGAHPNGFQHGGRKSTETSGTEFCYKSVNLSLEEIKNIKIILFIIHDLFR